MTQRTTFSVRFVLVKTKINKFDQAPIYARITVIGKQLDIATKKYVAPERWNNEAGAVKGNKEDARATNAILEGVKSELWNTFHELEKGDGPITAEAIKLRYLGLDKDKHTLQDVIKLHNGQMKELIGKQYAENTLKAYKSLEKHIGSFLTTTFKSHDRFLSQLDYGFIASFEHYLKKNGCSHNSAAKYIKCLRKLTNLAIKHGWLDKDPFAKYSIPLENKERVFLTMEDLEAISEKEISIPRLDAVRDIFLFSCYTGLAYADVAKLTPKDIRKGPDGENWIYTHRTKTEIKSNVPLLDVPKAIISKYKSHPDCKYSGKLLPVISNQKLNSYLKELADICGIHKEITFHTARHTFATTITLTNNVPIESVSAMLGHKNIRTTQIYAKVLDLKVSKDMQALRAKLA